MNASRSRRSGVAIFVCALTAFASYDAFCKHMLQFYPAPFVNLMRYVSVIVVAFSTLCRHGGTASRTRRR